MKKDNYFEKVYFVTKSIPRGRVTNYGAIANHLSLGSARMVGWALRHCPMFGGEIPAHRVVNRKGELSGRNAFPTPDLMQQLLEKEGIVVENNKVKNFAQIFWQPEEP